jgi:hypothetical protein
VSDQRHRVRIALLGVPAPLTNWLQVLLTWILQFDNGARPATLVIDSDEATERFLAAAITENSLIVSHFPRPALIDWLAERRIPTLVALDTPAASINLQARHSNLSPVEISRPITQSLSLLCASRQLPRHAIIGAEHFTIDVSRMSIMLATVMGIQTGTATERALETMLLTGDETVGEAVGKILETGCAVTTETGLSPEDTRVVELVIDPLIDMVRGHHTVELVWPVNYFFHGPSFTANPPVVQELVGPARCLYYGPFLHLPPGDYAGELTIGLTDEITDTRIRVEYFSDRVEAEFMARTRKGGLFALPFELTVRNSLLPMQLRIFLDQGEIYGTIMFSYARLRRIEPKLDLPNPPQIGHKCLS